MSIDVLTQHDLASLSKHRHPASVSIALPAPTPRNGSGFTYIAHDTEAARTAFRTAVKSAQTELGELGGNAADIEAIAANARALETDRDFWGTQARSIALFISPEGVRAFRLMNQLPASASVGDRFDLGPLLRAATFPHDGYLLAVTEGETRLLFLDADATARRVPLPTLADDVADLLHVDFHGGGQLDRHRADGTLGPKVQQRNFASAIQDAALAAIGDDTRPLVLAISNDLEPAYRAVNRYEHLLEASLPVNPASLSDDELAQRGRELLESHYAAEVREWSERFETRRAHGRGSSQLSDIAAAAVRGQVESLVFDFEHRQEGTMDEFGNLTFADSPGPESYALIDAIANHVLSNGGRVYALRSAELPDANSPAAAIFRTAEPA